MFTRHMLMNEAGESSSGGGSNESIESQEVDSEVLESEIEQDLTPAEIKKYRKLQLKFNGREIEEDLDFEVDEKQRDWMVKQRQKAMLADHKANEYNQLEREIGAFIQELRQNPKKALSNPAIGMDIKQFAAQILQEEIEQSQKTPEQIEREALEEELRAIREERENEKKEMSAKELERLTEREFERYDNLMSSALESSDLPKSPYVVKKMTEYMMLGIENNIDVSPSDVIPMIREELHRDIQEMFELMPAEVIEQIIGKGSLDKLRKRRVAGSKPPVPVKSSIADTGRRKEEPKKEEKRQTIKEFLGV
jgi:hypothetical protein